MTPIDFGVRGQRSRSQWPPIGKSCPLNNLKTLGPTALKLHVCIRLGHQMTPIDLHKRLWRNALLSLSERHDSTALIDANLMRIFTLFLLRLYYLVWLKFWPSDLLSYFWNYCLEIWTIVTTLQVKLNFDIWWPISWPSDLLSYILSYCLEIWTIVITLQVKLNCDLWLPTFWASNLLDYFGNCLYQFLFFQVFQ